MKRIKHILFGHLILGIILSMVIASDLLIDMSGEPETLRDYLYVIGMIYVWVFVCVGLARLVVWYINKNK